MMWIFPVVLVAVVLLLLLVRRAMRRRVLPGHHAKRLRLAMMQAEQNPDTHRKVMDADKIIESALTELGYTGTFSDKLKVAGPRFSNLQALWDAHKLRNRIAHEVGVHVSESEVRSAMQAFSKALKDLS